MQAAPLQLSPLLQEKLSAEERQRPTTFLLADELQGQNGAELRARGQVELRQPGFSIQTDALLWDLITNTVQTTGSTVIHNNGQRYSGQSLRLQQDSGRGQFEAERYELPGGAHGEMQGIEFLDNSRRLIRNASYTTCRRDGTPGWIPDWVLQTQSLEVDDEEATAHVKGAVLRFKDVPILPIPNGRFPLNRDRQSGWLAPTYSIDNVSGLELTVPYYWNIAPNRDATLYNTAMARRGAELGGEFRYLESNYNGSLRLNWMPKDSLTGGQRWGLTGQHSGVYDTGGSIDALRHIQLGLQVARVSDDDYWKDFPRAGLAVNPRLLPATGLIQGTSEFFSWQLQAQKFQSLQDSASPLTPPYDRLPQLSARYQREALGGNDAWHGLDFSMLMDATRFQADYSRIPSYTGAAASNGTRSFLQTELRLPWQRPWGYVTPKVQLHASHYAMDQALSTGATHISRVVPTLSLDSSLIFERETQLFSRSVQQTLEPRLFYVRTLYRDQSMLPLYDAGETDFNFSSIYNESPYVGHDRIADSHTLTMGLTSRWYDQQSGAELLRAGLAQRYRLSDQRVTLSSSETLTDANSDILGGLSVQWSPQWGSEALVRYNQDTRRLARSVASLRYTPGPYQVLNVAYRLNRGQSEQLDVAWQWPLASLLPFLNTNTQTATGQRWYGVGRINYSLPDSKAVDVIAGFEYDGGCWLARVVYERQQSSLSSAHQRLLLQLELLGLARIGSNPLKTLRDNIPRFQYLRESSTTPSRFTLYD